MRRATSFHSHGTRTLVPSLTHSRHHTVKNDTLPHGSINMLTDYEQRREARIARNREILMQLVGKLPAHQARQTMCKSNPPQSNDDADHTSHEKKFLATIVKKKLKKNSLHPSSRHPPPPTHVDHITLTHAVADNDVTSAVCCVLRVVACAVPARRRRGGWWVGRLGGKKLEGKKKK